MKVALVLAALGTSILVTTIASAAPATFTADLTPGQENVTPNVGAHSPKGSLKVSYDATTKQLCGEVKYSDLTGEPTAVQLFRAPAGHPEDDGTEKVDLPKGDGQLTFGVKLADPFETSLFDGELYVNIFTAANPTGEIRSVSPWIDEPDLAPVDCPAPPDAGADAGSTSSSSSSSSSGGASSSSSSSGDTTSGGTSSGATGSSSSGGGSSDAGTAAAATDGGGCSTTGETGTLSFAMVLGVGIAALSRGRRKKR